MKTTFDIQLSEHFKLSEFVQTDYSHFQFLGRKQFNNLCELVDEILEPLRQELKAPVIVTSGFRNVRVNDAVDGAKNSLHLLGLAVDIKSPAYSPEELYEYLKVIIKHSCYTLTDFELIKYPTFVHVGLAVQYPF